METETTISINGGRQHPINLDDIDEAVETLTEAHDEAGVVPFGDSVEVAADLEAAVDEEVARAESEGMHGVPLPIPGEGEAEADGFERRIAIDLKARELFGERAKARTLAVKELEAKRVHDKAKKATESQDDLVKLLTDELESIYNDEPGRQRVLPFDDRDGAKADIDAAFPKPEAIAPLPPDTVEEAVRRKLESTPLAEMGLKVGTLKALEGLELTTAGKVKRHFDSIPDAWDNPKVVKGMTEIRLTDLADAMIDLAKAATVEFEGAATAEESPEEGEADE